MGMAIVYCADGLLKLIIMIFDKIDFFRGLEVNGMRPISKILLKGEELLSVNRYWYTRYPQITNCPCGNIISNRGKSYTIYVCMYYRLRWFPHRHLRRTVLYAEYSFNSYHGPRYGKFEINVYLCNTIICGRVIIE